MNLPLTLAILSFTLFPAFSIKAIPPPDADVNLILVNGQSNVVGTNSGSMTWRRSEQLNGAEHGWGVYPAGYVEGGGELDGPGRITQSVPFTAYSLDFTGTNTIQLSPTVPAYQLYNGESVEYGVTQSIASEYPDWTVLFTGRGNGGRNIQFLDKPTPEEIAGFVPSAGEHQIVNFSESEFTSRGIADFASVYYRLLWIAANARQAVRDELGQTCSIRGIVWIHGTSNARTTDYDDRIIQFYDDLNADLNRIFENPEGTRIPVFYEQLSRASLTVNGNAIDEEMRVNRSFTLSKGQLRAHTRARDEGKALYLIAPRFVVSNETHLFPHAYRRLGEYFGTAIKQVAINNEPWEPVRPIDHEVVGNDLYLHFKVAHPPLQAATNSYSNDVLRPTLGFDLIDGPSPLQPDPNIVHPSNAIEAVEIVGPRTVRIRTTRPLDADDNLGYVRRWRNGNIADSSPATGFYPWRGLNGTDSTEMNDLKNYAVSFELSNIPATQLTALDDSDNDGLSDQLEVDVLGTSAARMDTDYDLATDREELLAGSDPNDGASVPDGFTPITLVTEDITVDTIWAGTVVLGRLITVGNDATLNITPGTIIQSIGSGGNVLPGLVLVSNDATITSPEVSIETIDQRQRIAIFANPTSTEAVLESSSNLTAWIEEVTLQPGSGATEPTITLPEGDSDFFLRIRQSNGNSGN